jgi:hypothetical protein
MRSLLVVIIWSVFSAAAFAADTPISYSDAKAIWQQKRGTPEYQKYAAEFAQFNNHFHLDVRDGCYALGPGSVDLMLVITHPDNSQYAVIKRVLSNVDNAKARCFEKSYRGVPTKVPPFLPFVLQMNMR